MVIIYITELVIETDRMEKPVRLFYPGDCCGTRKSVFDEVEMVRIENGYEEFGSKVYCYVWNYTGRYDYEKLIENFEKADNAGELKMIRYDIYRFSPGEIVCKEKKGVLHTVDSPFVKQLRNKHRILIPADILSSLQLKPGDEMEFFLDDEHGDCIILEKAGKSIAQAVQALQEVVIRTDLSAAELTNWKKIFEEIRNITKESEQ